MGWWGSRTEGHSLLDLSGWLLGQDSDATRENFRLVTRDMSQMDVGEAPLCLPGIFLTFTFDFPRMEEYRWEIREVG